MAKSFDTTSSQRTEVIQLPSKTQELFINLVMSAKEEVSLMLPTINAFYREELLGIIRLLKDAALDRKIDVRILTPINDVIEKIIGNITALLDQRLKFYGDNHRNSHNYGHYHDC